MYSDSPKLQLFNLNLFLFCCLGFIVSWISSEVDCVFVVAQTQ
jgi:hypothetical protein